MKQRGCARQWEVEAARDHRLDGDALRAAEEHRARCASCLREHASLEALSSRLRELGSAKDEVALRRSRNAVMERASRPGDLATRSLRKPVLGLALVGCVACASFVAWPSLRAARTPVTITASEGASFSRTIEPHLDRVRLDDGALSFDVSAHVDGRRFVVAVPDGEIEDLGTRFRVVTRAGRTEEISVEDGAVTFRRPGHPDLPLRAGERFRYEAAASPAPPSAAPIPEPFPAAPIPEPFPAAPAPAPSAVLPVPRPVACVEAPLLPRPRSAAPRAVPVEPSPRRAEPAPALPRVDAARSRLSAEERAEDEAYLVVVALLRERRHEEAKVAARAYIGRFPSGLRRREMDVIAE